MLHAPHQENTLADLNPTKLLANALEHGKRRLTEANKHFWQEVISDLPHLHDFFASAAAIWTGLSHIHCSPPKDLLETQGHILKLIADMQIPADTFELLPTLVLSGVGLYAGAVNITTLSRAKHAEEATQRERLLVFQHYNATLNPAVINAEINLSLTAIPDTGVRTFDEAQITKTDKVLNMPLLKRIHETLHAPAHEVLSAAAKTTLGFVWESVQDIIKNYTLPSRIRDTAQSFEIGIRAIKEVYVTRRADIQDLSEMLPIQDKIAQAKHTENETISIARKHTIPLSALEEEHIEHLDHIRQKTREMAQQLPTCIKSFTLTSAFIVSTYALSAQHGLEGDTLNAVFQFAALGLALTPFNGICSYTQNLLETTGSHRATEATLILTTFKETGHLPENEHPLPFD